MNLFVGMALWALGIWILWIRLRPLRGAFQSWVDNPIPDISIVVPARNEAHNLPILLPSLKALHPAAAEIIVVDDHSTDGTAQMAQASFTHVVTPPPLAPDWLGKPWACHAGFQHTHSSHLLFTDADTQFGPQLLGQAMAQMRRSGAALVSIVPTHRLVAIWEHLQGVFQLLLLVATRPGSVGTGERSFSIGQFLLFRRDVYEQIGGHVTVKNRVAEDLAFARLIREAGHKTTVLLAPGALTVRMYPEGLGGFLRGWRRNFREGIGAAGVVGFAEVFFAMVALLGPSLWLITAVVQGDATRAAIFAGAFTLSSALVAWHQRQIGRFHIASALLHPLFAALFAWVSLQAAFDMSRRAPVLWKGRSVSVTDRCDTRYG